LSHTLSNSIFKCCLWVTDNTATPAHLWAANCQAVSLGPSRLWCHPCCLSSKMICTRGVRTQEFPQGSIES
jgi:hypothetical protein